MQLQQMGQGPMGGACGQGALFLLCVAAPCDKLGLPFSMES